MEKVEKIEFTPEERTTVANFIELLGNYCDEVTNCEKCPFDEFCVGMKSTLDFMTTNGGVYLG